MQEYYFHPRTTESHPLKFCLKTLAAFKHYVTAEESHLGQELELVLDAAAAIGPARAVLASTGYAAQVLQVMSVRKTLHIRQGNCQSSS